MKLRHGLPGQLSPQAEFQWPELDSTFPKLGRQPGSRQWVGEFHYVPLRLLFKMANESRFLELTVGVSMEEKDPRQKSEWSWEGGGQLAFFLFLLERQEETKL